MLASDLFGSINVLVFWTVYEANASFKRLILFFVGLGTRERDDREGGERVLRWIFFFRGRPCFLLPGNCAIAPVCRHEPLGVDAVLPVEPTLLLLPPVFLFSPHHWQLESWVPKEPNVHVCYFHSFSYSVKWNGRVQFSGPTAPEHHHRPATASLEFIIQSVCGPQYSFICIWVYYLAWIKILIIFSPGKTLLIYNWKLTAQGLYFYLWAKIFFYFWGKSAIMI